MTTIALPVNQLTDTTNIISLEGVDYTELDDNQLAKIAGQDKDMEAFEQLYLRHHGRVYAVCLRMMRNTYKAEDMTQDVFIQVYRKLLTFRGDSAFTTWLHRVTVNQVLMYFRQQDVKLELCESNLNELALSELKNAPTVDNQTHLKIILEDAIMQLPDGYRRTFILHDFLGFEHKEVAEIMNVSTGTSKSQLHKARHRLRKLICRRTNPKI